MNWRRAVSLAAGPALAVGVMSAAATPASAAPYWSSIKASACANGGVANWSQLTRCYATKQLLSDGTSTYDYWSLRMKTTGYAINSKYMSKLWAEPYKSSTSPSMVWWGSDPYMPDTTVTTSSSCVDKSFSIGLTAGIVTASFSETTTVCKNQYYGPKIYSDAGHVAAVWWADPGARLPAGIARSVAAMETVRTAQSKVPVWSYDRWGANTNYSQTS